MLLEEKEIYLEMCWMSELPVTVRTCESSLISMCHQMIVETVLSGECCSTQTTFKRSQSSMTPKYKR